MNHFIFVSRAHCMWNRATQSDKESVKDTSFCTNLPPCISIFYTASVTTKVAGKWHEATDGFRVLRITPVACPGAFLSMETQLAAWTSNSMAVGAYAEVLARSLSIYKKLGHYKGLSWFLATMIRVATMPSVWLFIRLNLFPLFLVHRSLAPPPSPQ